MGPSARQRLEAAKTEVAEVDIRLRSADSACDDEEIGAAAPRTLAASGPPRNGHLGETVEGSARKTPLIETWSPAALRPLSAAAGLPAPRVCILPCAPQLSPPCNAACPRPLAASRPGPQVGLRLVERELAIAQTVRLGRGRLENAISRVIVGPRGLTMPSKTGMLRPYDTALKFFRLPLSVISLLTSASSFKAEVIRAIPPSSSLVAAISTLAGRLGRPPPPSTLALAKTAVATLRPIGKTATRPTVRRLSPSAAAAKRRKDVRLVI